MDYSKVNYSIDIMEMATEHTVDHIVSRLPRSNQNEVYNWRYIFTIICFATPVEVLTKDGMEHGEPGDCIITAPTFHEYHRTGPGEEKGFVNDWLHVCVENPYKLDEVNPPLNTLIRTKNPMFLRHNMELISNELMHRKMHYEKLVSNLIEHILIKLSRVYLARHDTSSDSEYKSQLLALRHKIKKTISQNWTVERMAKDIGLSTSRFSVVYRKQFNCSPIEDILEMRITEAKRLLISNKFSIRRIALHCGFKNEYYFSRFFKERVGIAPSAYRSDKS